VAPVHRLGLGPGPKNPQHFSFSFSFSFSFLIFALKSPELSRVVSDRRRVVIHLIRESTCRLAAPYFERVAFTSISERDKGCVLCLTLSGLSTAIPLAESEATRLKVVLRIDTLILILPIPVKVQVLDCTVQYINYR